MISINYKSIPAYLQRGDFYRALSEDDPIEIVTVPAACFKENDTVHTRADINHLLRVMDFWLLDEIPTDVIRFCQNQPLAEWRHEIMDLPRESNLCRTLELVFHKNTGYASLIQAIKSGRLDLVSHLAATRPEDCIATNLAAHQGRLDILRMLHENGHPWDCGACYEAASGGHLDCLMYLHVNGCEWTSHVLECAGRNGHLNCVQYAHQQGLPWSDDLSSEIAKNGHLPTFMYALNNGCPCDSTAVRCAARAGHVELLRYMLQRGLPVDSEVSSHAATTGQVECLHLIYQHHAPMDSNTTAAAASGHQLEALRFLHLSGCPWDEQVPNIATYTGDIAVLRYALQHDCPHSGKDLVRRAAGASKGALACLQYLIGELALYMNEDGSVFAEAFVRGDYECIEYLLDAGCPMVSKTYDVRIMWGHIGRYVHDFERTQLDVNIARCIVCATGRGWNLKTDGTDLVNFVNRYCELYPQCYMLCCDLL